MTEQKPGIKAVVLSLKGTCAAGHKTGDTFSVDCVNPGGLCGFFYNQIFPTLAVYQYGGRMPWWQGDTLTLSCPDRHNELTIRIEKTDG